jgi:hypothetical protein
MGAALVGTALSAYGQYRQGEVDEQVARNNAILARYQMRDAVQQGTYRAADIEGEGKRVIGAARAAVSTSGVDSSSGSAANLFTTSAVNAGIDAQRAKSQAARVAWGFANEEQDTLARSRMARQAGILGSVGTGLNGIGNYAQSRA